MICVFTFSAFLMKSNPTKRMFRSSRSHPSELSGSQQGTDYEHVDARRSCVFNCRGEHIQPY
jgi:hypothetical protein